jgi:hypothetical protein
MVVVFMDHDVCGHCYTSLLFIEKFTLVKDLKMVVCVVVGYNYYGACGGIMGGILIMTFM